MDIEKIRQNKTGSIFSFGIPATIGMLMTSLITIVDGYFAGNYVGADALVAINLGVPVLYFYLAVGLMIGVGGSVIAGISIGKADRDKANETFSQTMTLAAGISIFVSVIVAIFFEPIMKVLGAQGQVAELFRQYYRIFLFSAPLLVIDSCYGMFLRADGEPQIYMAFNGFSILLNAFLDFLFTAKFSLGIKGLIIASLISLSFSSALSTVYFLLRKSKSENQILLKFKSFKWNENDTAKIFLNGSSECIGEFASCVSMFCYNFVLLKYAGEKGVAAFTILGYSMYVFNMIGIGFGEGMCPLVSFCFGAGEKQLCASLRKITNRILFVIGCIFATALFLGARVYSSFFVQDEEIVLMVVRGFRLFVFDFVIQGFNVVGSMYFTSCGRAKESAVIASARGIVILLISIFVFSALWGIDGIWLTAPVTELLTLFITIFLFKKARGMEQHEVATGLREQSDRGKRLSVSELRNTPVYSD